MKTPECIFGQTESVAGAFSEDLNSFPPVEMHNSDHIITFSGILSNLIGDSRPLIYNHDLLCASRLI